METPPDTSASGAPRIAVTALRLEGKDALDLLHRISTAFLTDLAPGEGRATMFCDFRGRLLFRVWVARDAEAVWLRGDDAPPDALVAFLDRHIFREEVRIVDASGAASAPPLPDSERFASEEARIRAGHPRHGREIVEEFTPFEIGRAHEVHLDKGCFTGQEALMRLVTYRSVRRRLARVEGAGAPPAAPADVLRDGTRLGRLTSAAAIDPAATRWIGLAVLAHEAIERPEGLSVSGDALGPVTAFPITRPLGLPESVG